MCRWIAGGLRGIARATVNVCRRIRHGRVAKTRVETALEAHRAEMGRQVFKTYFSLKLNFSEARRVLNVVFVSKTSGAEFYEGRLCFNFCGRRVLKVVFVFLFLSLNVNKIYNLC